MKYTLFASYRAAENAYPVVKELIDYGIPAQDIGFATNDSSRTFHEFVEREDISASEGASFGAGEGAFVGLLTGLAAITVPGIGAIAVAGPLAAALGGAIGAAIGATAGAVTGGLVAKLVDLGLSDEEANFYAELLRRGGAVVVIAVPEDKLEVVQSIVKRHQPVEMEHTIELWRQDDWQEFDEERDPYTHDEIKNVRDTYIVPPYPIDEDEVEDADNAVKYYTLIPPM